MSKSTSTFFLAVAGYTNGLSIRSSPRQDLLAQLRQATNVEHTCSTSHRRVANSSEAVTNFQSILEGTEQYTDSAFPYNDALYWAD